MAFFALGLRALMPGASTLVAAQCRRGLGVFVRSALHRAQSAPIRQDARTPAQNRPRFHSLGASSILHPFKRPTFTTPCCRPIKPTLSCPLEFPPTLLVAPALSAPGRGPLSIVLFMLGTYAVVFVMFRAPREAVRCFAARHFMTSPFAIWHERRLYTAITSAFSHVGGIHLAFTSFSLFCLAPPLVEACVLTQESLAAAVLGAAFFSSVAGTGLDLLFVKKGTVAWKRTLATRSLGASGVICALLVVFAHAFPQSNFYVMLIPIPIAAPTLLWLLPLLDTVGLLYNRRALARGTGTTRIGHSAHLMGYVFGFLLVIWIRSEHRKRRKRGRGEQGMEYFS